MRRTRKNLVYPSYLSPETWPDLGSNSKLRTSYEKKGIWVTVITLFLKKIDVPHQIKSKIDTLTQPQIRNKLPQGICGVVSEKKNEL